MHIGIDGSRCNQTETTGVERYAQLIIAPLIKELTARGHKVTVYAKAPSPLFSGATVKISKQRFFWSQIFLGLKAQTDGVDCLFVSAHILPFFRPKKNVVFIHDVCFEEMPAAYSFFQRWYLRLTTADAARTARIITHSQSTKEKIINIFGARSVSVVHPAAVSVVKNETPIAWRKPYLLYVGRIETKKNLLLLFKAFELLAVKALDFKHDLVMLGKDGFGGEEIKKYWNNMRFKNRVILYGYAPDALRDQALREASGLVLPSYCEGSSLVLLEARAARVPFASGACQSCREAGGEKGIYVNNNRVEDWAAALYKLATHSVPPLPPPDRTWQDVARDVAEVLLS